MAKRRKFTDEEILAQIPAAKARSVKARAAGMRAESVRYDAGRGRVIMELSSGHIFGFPVTSVPALNGASQINLQAVELSPSGSGLHWDALDVDLEVAALVTAALGHEVRVRELARAAGSVSTQKKAAAARENGAKGGRPSSKHPSEHRLKDRRQTFGRDSALGTSVAGKFRGYYDKKLGNKNATPTRGAGIVKNSSKGANRPVHKK